MLKIMHAAMSKKNGLIKKKKNKHDLNALISYFVIARKCSASLSFNIIYGAK